MSTQDPLSEAREALRQAQTDLYNANAYFGGAKLEPILARLNTLPAPSYVRGNDHPPRSMRERIGRWLELVGDGGIPVVRRSGWFYPDPPEVSS